MSTKTRFEKEAKGNSEMAYYNLALKSTDKSEFDLIDLIYMYVHVA